MTTTPYAAFAGAALVVALGLTACTQQVEPATPSAGAASGAAAAVANVSDVDINEHVKTALLRSEMLKGTDITVLTTQGDVSLTGTLRSQAQVDEAIRIARAAEGIHAVHDHLTVKK
jgi:hyperosmotically inducible periplasmic protein